MGQHSDFKLQSTVQAGHLARHVFFFFSSQPPLPSLFLPKARRFRGNSRLPPQWMARQECDTRMQLPVSPISITHWPIIITKPPETATLTVKHLYFPFSPHIPGDITGPVISLFRVKSKQKNKAHYHSRTA